MAITRLRRLDRCPHRVRTGGGGITSIIAGGVPADRSSDPIEGTLVDVDGCASVVLPGDIVYPIVWPGGFDILDNGAAIGDHHGRVRLGQRLSSKGYIIDRAELMNFSDPPAQLRGIDACSREADALVVLTQVEDFDTTE